MFDIFSKFKNDTKFYMGSTFSSLKEWFDGKSCRGMASDMWGV